MVDQAKLTQSDVCTYKVWRRSRKRAMDAVFRFQIDSALGLPLRDIPRFPFPIAATGGPSTQVLCSRWEKSHSRRRVENENRPEENPLLRRRNHDDALRASRRPALKWAATMARYDTATIFPRLLNGWFAGRSDAAEPGTPR